MREEQIEIKLPDLDEIETRLENVLRTIYLLFNEGYYSISQNHPVRKDLCFEAIRLCYLLVENEQTNKPATNALLALMCLQASRFDARFGSGGELILYDDQDPELWDVELISKGTYFLNQAAQGNKLSGYHLEAAIAWWNTQKEDTKEKWGNILLLYNQLLQINYSPVAALNRTYVLSKVHGKRRAIEEAEKLKLEDNQFYFTLLGELYTGIDKHKALKHFQMAIQLVKSSADKQLIQKKLEKLHKE